VEGRKAGRKKEKELDGRRMYIIASFLFFVNVSGYENILARCIACTEQMINCSANRNGGAIMVKIGFGSVIVVWWL